MQRVRIDGLGDQVPRPHPHGAARQHRAHAVGENNQVRARRHASHASDQLACLHVATPVELQQDRADFCAVQLAFDVGPLGARDTTTSLQHREPSAQRRVAMHENGHMSRVAHSVTGPVCRMSTRRYRQRCRTT